MANNRLWLMHRPSGKAVFLSKRGPYGWYGPPDDIAAQLLTFFHETIELSDGREQDDFLLLMEDAENAPGASEDPELLRLVLNPEGR